MEFRQAVLISAVSLFAGACGDNGPSSLSGSLAFGYSGGVTGNFSASGAIPLTGLETATWAAGERDAANQVLDVVASAPRNSTSHDLVGVSIARLTVGSSTITTCNSNVCTGMTLIVSASNTTSGYDTACYLTTGTVTISSISSTRATGTFSGTGECQALSGGGPSSFTVTGGTFDVALASGIP